MMYSAQKSNKQGDNIRPWCTPPSIWNESVVPCPVLTVTSWSAYRFLRKQVRWSGMPISFRIFHSLFVIHTVKGFSIVNEAKIMFFWNSLAFSMIQQMLAIWSLVPLPFLNPPWIRVNSRRWWRTGMPGVLWYIGLQNVGHDLATAQQQQGDARKEWYIWHCVKQYHYLKQSQKTLTNWEKISVRYHCRYINNSRKFFNEG